jgi:hypothetical protein
MQIRPAGDELFRANGQTDRHNEAFATSGRRIKTESEMTLVKGTAPGATLPFRYPGSSSAYVTILASSARSW